ncbi:MAG: type II toxin-antitoxin system RelE/ParE family toxin [Verrucomicrobiota bacterium]
MIVSFACRETEKVFSGRFSKKLPHDIQARARSKLMELDTAASPEDLRFPPGNHLEQLSGDMDDRMSIRVNQQWRIVFRWEDGNSHDIKIEDYH